MDVHTDNAQKLAHVVLAEHADIETESGESSEITPVRRAESRWRLVDHAPKHARKAPHALAKAPILLGIVGGDTVRLLLGQSQMRPVFGKRDRVEVFPGERRRQVEVLQDFGLQLVQEVCTGGYRESVRELARHGGAADDVVGLEDEHAVPTLRERGGAHEPVMTRADNYGIPALSHRQSSPGQSSGASDPTGFRGPRWRPALPSHRRQGAYSNRTYTGRRSASGTAHSPVRAG